MLLVYGVPFVLVGGVGGGEYCRPISHGYLDRGLVTAVDCTAVHCVQAHGIGQPLGRLYFNPLINIFKKDCL
jgi:hypothetical protein